MTHPSKRKGNVYEREIVNQAKAAGISAERAYASNGEALGECAEVDVVIGGVRIQAKRRADLASYLLPGEGVDAVVARADGGESLIVFRFDDFVSGLAEVAAAKGGRAATCPHGAAAAECESCMTESDYQYDCYQERQAFGGK